MRYLAACDRFVLDQPGGAYRIAWDLAKLMRDRGHEAALLCGSTESDPGPGAEIVEGITVVRYRFPRGSSLSPFRWRDHVHAARIQARRELANVPWDVVHAHTPASGTAAFKECGGGARLVYTVHSPVQLEQATNLRDRGFLGRVKLKLSIPILARSERELTHAAATVHVLSDFTRRCILAAHGEELRGRMITIPWWARPVEEHGRQDARERLGWPLDQAVFFTLRRLVPRMGLDTLLAAAARVSQNGRFWVAIGGDGPERERLERAARDSGMSGRVVFHGRMSEEAVSLAYAGCDAFVLPTRDLECFGIPAVDALAHDRPVFGSDAGAIPEVVGGVLPAWIFKAGDHAGLAALMGRFLRGTLAAPPPGTLKRHAAETYGERILAPRYVAILEGTSAR